MLAAFVGFTMSATFVTFAISNPKPTTNSLLVQLRKFNWQAHKIVEILKDESVRNHAFDTETFSFSL